MLMLQELKMKVDKDRLIESFKKLIVYSGIFHLGVLFVHSILNFDLEPLNFFNIIDLTLFFPSLSKGLGSQLLSFLTVLASYSAIYIFVERERE